MDIGKNRIFIAAAVKKLDGGKRRPGKRGLRIAEEKTDLALGKKREVLVLEVIGCVDQMLAVGEGQRGIEIRSGAPGEVVAVEAVLLDAKRGKLVRISSQAQRIELKLIEPTPMAIARLNPKRA